VQIVVDDMGYGDFGVFGDGASTPALDHLVKESVCFTQHYSGSCVCAPARAALLTGRYPHRTGAIDTLEGRGLDRLALGEVTIADLLQSQGYHTGLVGKWHLGALDKRYHPNARGFTEFVGFCGGWQDYDKWRLDANGHAIEADGRYLTDVFTEEAIQFVRRHRHEPFYLHLAYNAPHFPFQAPDEEVAPFIEAGRYTRAVSIIYAMLRRMDRGLERVLDELMRLGLADNTLVMFTSDNGPQFGGEGEMNTTRHNCGYHGAKGSVYEGGIRVPMVVRWPGGLDGGRRCDDMVHFCDWLPTLLAVARVSAPNVALDGHDLLPVLRGDARAPSAPRFWQWNRYTPLVTCNAAMRDGPWKLVRPRIDEAMGVAPADLEMDRDLKYAPDRFSDICRDPEPERDVPPPSAPELYHMDRDPLEQHDLAAQEPARVSTMLTALEEWFEQVDAERRATLEEP
jgi:arylsulfatase A